MFDFSLQNIDFLPTILSRFDMIFIVKDEHDVARDTVFCLPQALTSIYFRRFLLSALHGT